MESNWHRERRESTKFFHGFVVALVPGLVAWTSAIILVKEVWL